MFERCFNKENLHRLKTKSTQDQIKYINTTKVMKQLPITKDLFDIKNKCCGQQTDLSATARAFSTSARSNKAAIYFIQTKLLFGELLTNFSKSSGVRGISPCKTLSSTALISNSLLKTIEGCKVSCISQ